MTISLQAWFYLQFLARRQAQQGKGNSEPSLTEAEGSRTSWPVAMQVLHHSHVVFTGRLVLQGKENSEPSLSEAGGSGTCWQDALRSLQTVHV
jgi:hypothetical protein